MLTKIPQKSYGVLSADSFGSHFDETAEQIRRLGYAVLDSGYSVEELEALSNSFERVKALYVKKWGIEFLRRIDEHNTIRAPLLWGEKSFINLAANPSLLQVLKKLILGKFILNQQNGIINPSLGQYNQGSWHRDLPYQHFVTSRPIAINALFCLDDFTEQNGSTFVLPASHKAEAFPSSHYIRNNAIQVIAKRGQFILLDCMLFHSGGENLSSMDRRGINHVYTIPYFKQQVKLGGNINTCALDAEYSELFGLTSEEPDSVEKFLALRGAALPRKQK
jgi:ectoine hydroxylase-related dioxygenase (phytanoyl-CoA dioxygenase family)